MVFLSGALSRAQVMVNRFKRLAGGGFGAGVRPGFFPQTSQK
jgi:hypothetical protein